MGSPKLDRELSRRRPPGQGSPAGILEHPAATTILGGLASTTGDDGHRLATSTRSRVNFLRFDMPSDTELLERLYDSFNARDIGAALATMHPDVIWANGLEGGHVHGHDGVRDYWTRQWAMMDSHAEPSGFSIGEDGTAYVEVHLTACDLHGNALFDAKASHVFQIEDGLIRRFDIRK